MLWSQILFDGLAKFNDCCSIDIDFHTSSCSCDRVGRCWQYILQLRVDASVGGHSHSFSQFLQAGS